MQLFDWQEPFRQRLLDILKQYDAGLCALPTGAGKTYIAAAVVAELKKPVFVVCPKSVITTWREVLEGFGITPLTVLNWEKIKTGNTGWLTRSNRTFSWQLPPDALVIVDEIHKGASGPKTQTTRAMAMLKAYKGLKVLGCSATIADSPLKMRAIGYLLDLHRFNDASFYDWCRQNGCFTSPYSTGLEFPRGPKGAEHMALIHRQIKNQLIKCAIADIPGFPESVVESKLYDLDTKYRHEINEIYKKMEDELKQPGVNPLTIQLRARQRTELLKVPLLIDLALDAIEEDTAPVLFVNFRETLERVAGDLRARGHRVSTVQGDQKDRDAEIRAFQANESRACICMLQAGGVAVSLHDVRHERPRVSFITPSFNATEVVQALGRIHRAGGTPVVQQFVLISGTVEEKIHKAIKQKSLNISALQDSDLLL